MKKDTIALAKLEVICGPMFSGKSEELMRRLRRAIIARQSTMIFKPKIDGRYDSESIYSHCGNKLKAYSIEKEQEILDLIKNKDINVIGIDEIQFFSSQIIPTICTLIESGKRVIVAGLDLDYRCIPFGSMPTLLALADNILKLHAICNSCGASANFSQRIINKKPAPFDDALVKIGGNESYQARCRSCHIIDKKPFQHNLL